MQEIEAKLLNISPEEIRAKLLDLKAKRIFPERIFKRIVLVDDDDKMEKKNAFLRLRDEEDKVLLSYKQIKRTSIDGTTEISIIVDDFNKTRELLKVIGFKEVYYQETKREEWKIESVLFDIDTWPGLDPFLEIEVENKEDIEKYISLLKLEDKEQTYARIGEIYSQVFGRDIINEYPILTFDTKLE